MFRLMLLIVALGATACAGNRRSPPATHAGSQPPPVVFVAPPTAGGAQPQPGANRPPPGRTAAVQPGPMPPMGSFTGVYYSPLFGYLHLVQQGPIVRGRWQRPRKGQWGELNGTANGNLLRFAWTEHGSPGGSQSGRGYFLYHRPPGQAVDDVLNGQLGRGQDEVGMAWDALKQRNVRPDIEAIGHGEPAELPAGPW